jgi:Xaa-Pro aminopeptidase
MIPAPYAQRRSALARQLGAKGIAIIPTAPERQRNRDSDFCTGTTATSIT